MLFHLLPHNQADSGVAEAPCIATPDRTLGWAEFWSLVDAERVRWSAVEGTRVGLSMAPTIASFVQLVALTRLNCHVFLLGNDNQANDLAEWARDFHWAFSLSESSTEAIAYESSRHAADAEAVTILTSGTTGKPKAAEHSWNSLARPVRRSTTDEHPVWLLTYRPHLYAGLQVMLQSWLNGGCLVMPTPRGTASQVAQLAARARVEYASATPSYWRWLLSFGDRDTLSSIPLRQITLGGEAVDQVTIDALRQVFPMSRVVHIYASTELGRCFSVTDGKAGFPAAYLDRVSSDGVRMRIEDGELIVRSDNAMTKYDGADPLGQNEFPTGDLVEVDGDRVYFVGRKTEMINVGGNKVYPLTIEQLVRTVAGVADARVFGEPSSILGQLVKCEVVVSHGCDPADVVQAIHRASRSTLATHERPRLIDVVNEIPRTSAGKVKR